MATSGVARRYARALFEIAETDQDFDGWLRDLRSIQTVLEDPTVSAFLENPAIATEQKLRLIDHALGDIGTKPRNFVYVLVENGRTGLIGDVVAAFSELLDRRRGLVHARVTTAVHLNEEETDYLTRRLEELTGRRVVLSTSVDPSILGGFVARIGDQLIDASVRGRLNALRESLMA